MSQRRRRVTDPDYQRLLQFRTGLRSFLRWSARQAGGVGLTPAQHQLLLAIRGHKGSGKDVGPTIGDVSRYLLIKPHTAGELVSRAVDKGLVRRLTDDEDARVVRLQLTALGARKVEGITEATLEELKRLAPQLNRLWEGLDEPSR